MKVGEALLIEELSKEIINLSDDLNRDMSELKDSVHHEMSGVERTLRRDIDRNTRWLQLVAFIGGIIICLLIFNIASGEPDVHHERVMPVVYLSSEGPINVSLPEDGYLPQ